MKNKSVRAAQLFEFYVKYVWPTHKLLAKKRLSRRCFQCGASEKMLPLNNKQVCTECDSLSFEKNPKNALDIQGNQKELETLLINHQNSGPQKYDALILFSGGKDSTYMIRRVQLEYPNLRILAVTIDNGFMSPIAKENIDFLIPKLKVDHIYIRPQKEFYIKLFKYTLTHLNQDGCYGTVDFSDGEFLLDSARRLAIEMEIPLILCGYSRLQVINGLKLSTFESPKEMELKDRIETAGIKLKDIFTPDEIKHWWHPSLWPNKSKAKLLFPLFCWNPNEDELLNFMKSQKLLTPKKYSPIATNHRLVPLLGVVDVHQFGYSSFEKEFCRMIREGSIDKKHWQSVFEFLEYTSKTGLFVKPAVMEALSELGLTLNEVKINFD